MFFSFRPLKVFETDQKKFLKDVFLSLGWVLSGSISSITCLYSTWFKVVPQRETDSRLADQIRSWFEIEPYRAFKQADPRSAADARAQINLKETTYHDGSRYHVGKLWVDDRSCLPNYQFSSSLLNAVSGKILTWSNSFLQPSVTMFQKVESSWSKSPLVLKSTNPLCGTYHTTLFFTRTNLAKYDASSTARLSFMAIRWG